MNYHTSEVSHQYDNCNEHVITLWVTSVEIVSFRVNDLYEGRLPLSYVQNEHDLCSFS
jgi:hypothetical protein